MKLRTAMVSLVKRELILSKERLGDFVKKLRAFAPEMYIVGTLL